MADYLDFYETTKDMCSRCRSQYFHELSLKEKEELIDFIKEVESFGTAKKRELRNRRNRESIHEKEKEKHRMCL